MIRVTNPGAGALRVSNPPSGPTLIWDGECHFCRRWIERWRVLTADRIDYITNQEIGERFPEIPREQLESSIVYIDVSGNVFFAAEAACRSLGVRSSRR